MYIPGGKERRKYICTYVYFVENDSWYKLINEKKENIYLVLRKGGKYKSIYFRVSTVTIKFIG